ncbi:hypothetical protein ACFSO7_09280 [Bacillus sp. CGMCC 1.16607]|uniref:hypothetical protein n=1 Tax=Bacillus sp. CGMCC 1.16607 TaxID=3351842 RepID=UPI00362C507D
MKYKLLLFIFLLLIFIPGLLFINKDIRKQKKTDISAISTELGKENEIENQNEKQTLIQELEQKPFEEFSKYVYELTPPNNYSSVHNLIYGTKVNWQGSVISKTNNSMSVLGDNNTIDYNKQTFSQLINDKEFIPYIIIVDLQDGISTQDLKPGTKIQFKGTLTKEGSLEKKDYWRIIDSTYFTLN